MSIYLINYILFFAFSLFAANNLKLQKILLFTFSIYLILFIGLRYSVGSDWGVYYSGYLDANDNNFNQYVDLTRDPGYWGLSYFFSILGIDYRVFSLLISSIFVFFYSKFLLRLKYPLLQLCISYPYIHTIIAMNAVRQSLALAIFSFIFILLLENKRLKAGLYFFLGLLFHKSLILMAPIYLIKFKRGFIFFMAPLIVIIGYYLFSYFGYFYKFEQYIINEKYNIGIFFRYAINSILIFYCIAIIGIKNLSNLDPISKLLILFTVLSFFLMFFYPTFVDRFSIYLFLMVPVLVSKSFNYVAGPYRTLHYLGLHVFYFLYLLFWLLTANQAYKWIPYQVFL